MLADRFVSHLEAGRVEVARVAEPEGRDWLEVTFADGSRLSLNLDGNADSLAGRMFADLIEPVYQLAEVEAPGSS